MRAIKIPDIQLKIKLKQQMTIFLNFFGWKNVQKKLIFKIWKYLTILSMKKNCPKIFET